MRDIECEVAAVFAEDVAEHRLIVRLDQGLHRHLLFERREHSWNNRFELVTWPGKLAISGDRGAHVFSRLPDMFQFFRSNGNTLGINPTYWSEKLVDERRSVQVYSEDRLWEKVREHLADAAREYREELAEWRGLGSDPQWRPFVPEKLRRARELVREARDWGQAAYEDGGRQFLRELEDTDVVSDTYGWDLTDWDFHFLWCLHAIAWGVRQYDAAVRSGLHKVRPPLVAWDTPLPTKPPTKPAERKAVTHA